MPSEGAWSEGEGEGVQFANDKRSPIRYSNLVINKASPREAGPCLGLQHGAARRHAARSSPL